MKRAFNLLDIDLRLFDGEGGAPAGGAESGVASATGKEGPEAPQKVVYGKVEGNEATPKQESKPDPNEAFESMIKGEYKEQFDKRVQDIINKRFKDAKSLESKVQELDPLVKLLERKYGTGKAQELYAKMEAEYIEEMAYSEGMSPENYRRIMQADQIAAQNAEMQRQYEQERIVQAQIQKWTQEAEALKAEYPDFDLSTAAQNEQFMDLIKSNVPVKAAYELLNIDNIKADIARKAQAQVAQNIQTKQSRPKEAASKGQQGVVIKSDVSKLTAQDRAEIAKRAQRGEIITF